MMGSQNLNLEQLGETYEIIGELTGDNRSTRAFMAKRRADEADVLITVARTPEGDQGNALSHLAADVTLLLGRRHRNLLPVIEGQWLSDDTLAVVTERPNAPSLEELLVRRDEEFGYPRIASLLQDVNGVIEWAREQKVVHRSLDASSVFVEPGSDRVLVAFVARPLPLAEMPGAEDDARTVAALARDMLTRGVAAPERANQPLNELRPGLPARVIQQTQSFLAPASATAKRPDVTDYIASIAMADALKRAESECERLFHAERDELQKEREGIKRALDEQKEAFAIERQALANERRMLDEERSVLADAGAQLQARAPREGERAPAGVAPIGKVDLTRARETRRQGNRVWRWSMVAGVLALIVVPALIVFGRRSLPPTRQPRNQPAERVVDSAAGSVATVAAPSRARTDTVIGTASGLAVPRDLMSGVLARAAESPPVEPKPRPRPRRREPQRYYEDPAPRYEVLPPSYPPDPVYRPAYPPDTIVRDTLRPSDTLWRTPAPPPGVPIRYDSLGNPRRDSLYRRDTIRPDPYPYFRRDTLMRRDTIVRRDTLAPPRDTLPPPG